MAVHPVAGLQAEDVGGADAGAAMPPRGRRGDADVETQESFHVRIAGHGIVARRVAARLTALWS